MPSNANMIPASAGKSSASVGSVPAEAKMEGRLNEGPPPEQREVVTPKKLDSGPKRGDKGEFMPAAYLTKSGSTRQDR